MKYTEVDVLNYVDGRLNDSQTAEFLATLRTDANLARMVAAMQCSQQPILDAYQQNPLPPVPDSLRDHVADMALKANIGQSDISPQSSQTRRSLASGIGFAACLVLGVCVGVLLSQLNLRTDDTNSDSSVATTASPAGVHERLVKRVADYQSLYVENTVASLTETNVEDAQELLESIRQRTGAQFSIMDYSSYGYEFARAQELGFEGQTLVQLVYRKPGAAPLALCFMPSTHTSSKALSVSQQNQLHTASWIANSQHYILVADENNATMQQLYELTINKI